MRIIVFPRDENPYQDLLYAAMSGFGVKASYLGELTPSRSLNTLLLPAEILMRRVAGARLLHVHWVYGFALPGSNRSSVLRHLAQVWFGAFLLWCRMLGVRIVWTAHNVLPHERVFANDLRARKWLATLSDLVIAHSDSTLAELARLGVTPRRAVVIPHGPLPANVPASLRPPGTDEDRRRFLFVGRIREYKGVEDLLAAFGLLSASRRDVALTVAGSCEEPLRSRLRDLAAPLGARATLHFGHVPDDELEGLMSAADAVVLPFRQVTTSGSAVLALTYGRPLVIPDLAALATLPDDAVVRYDSSINGLARALTQIVDADGPLLASMSAAAMRWSTGVTWAEIAELTFAELQIVRDSRR